ncbi:MAG: hypothetical protein K0Q79_1614 [Flavipsychrobacter sp.]|jgi:hypothetical protein|nr:hypothetical protein [Flavipsychrobacter sp.]
MTDNITASAQTHITGTGLVPWWKLTLFILLAVFLPQWLHAQNEEPMGDEITVTLEVKGVGNVDVPAMYNDKDVFLSVTAVFDFLKIKNIPSPTLDTVKGFILTEKDAFLLDRPHNRIYYQGKVIDLQDGFMHTETSLYLNLKYFKSVFGLDGTFYFRRLVVTMSSDFELPIIREMRQELMRRNLNKLKGDQKADTFINLRRPLFHLGAADWAVMSSQQSQGADQTTLNLGLGGALLGGEANASLNYYSNQAFSEKQQFYQWRYVNNGLSAMRQVIAGKIFTQATSSLFAPVVGVQVTNAPTTYRQSYGTYRLSNTTEPNWIVELYVNDVLVDYTRADASGFYSFDVPLFYGFTTVKLKFYGPYGEQRTNQQYINIPFNFLPKGEFEYSASAGIVEDDKGSQFSRVNMKYGLSSKITMGGGVEYLSSVVSGTTMPFISTSVRLTSRMLFSGEYMHGVRSRGLLSYRMKGGAQIDLDYTKYAKGQTAIYFNYLEERKAVITAPIRTKKMSLFSRLTLDQIIVPNTQYTNIEWAMLGFYKKVGINFTTYASVIPRQAEKVPYLYSIASVTVPLPFKILMTSQVQYNFKEGTPIFARFNFEKHLFTKGVLTFGYQEYFNINQRNFLLGLRYDFSFARAAVSLLSGSDGSYSRVEAASGSLVFDARSNFINANNRTNVGKAGILIRPFLDFNGNNQWDKGEPKAPGLKIRINGGRVINDERDTSIRILDLEPYFKYYIELNRSSFDNISWQVRNTTLSVTASPNGFTRVEVPIRVVGEVSGSVSVQNKDTDKPRGQGQISVVIYDSSSMVVGKAITESDGYFSYLGLVPGSYTVRIDSVQLNNLHYTSQPGAIPVTIRSNMDGDVADGLEFVLTSTAKDTTGKLVEKETVTDPVKKDTAELQKPIVKQPVQKDTVVQQKPVVQQPVKEPKPAETQPAGEVIGEKGSYAILVEVYGDITPAAILKTKIIHAYKVPVSIMQDGIDYKVEMVGFKSRAEAAKHLPRLREWGFPEALIIKLKEHILR